MRVTYILEKSRKREGSVPEFEGASAETRPLRRRQKRLAVSGPVSRVGIFDLSRPRGLSYAARIQSRTSVVLIVVAAIAPIVTGASPFCHFSGWLDLRMLVGRTGWRRGFILLSVFICVSQLDMRFRQRNDAERRAGRADRHLANLRLQHIGQ